MDCKYNQFFATFVGLWLLTRGGGMVGDGELSIFGDGGGGDDETATVALGVFSGMDLTDAVVFFVASASLGDVDSNVDESDWLPLTVSNTVRFGA
jgi:hypothetical protein